MMTLTLDITDLPDAEDIADRLLYDYDSFEDYRLFLIAQFSGDVREVAAHIFLNTYSVVEVAACGDDPKRVIETCEMPHTTHQIDRMNRKAFSAAEKREVVHLTQYHINLLRTIVHRHCIARPE